MSGTSGGSRTRERQERKRCLQCHGSTLHLVTERKTDSGDWVAVRERRICGHRIEDDPEQARPLMRSTRMDTDSGSSS